MGERGLVPKRTQARRRRNLTDEAGGKYRPDRVNLQKFDGELVEMGDPPQSWHKAAKAVWNAARESGQRIFFEPSDLAVLALTCDQITQLYSNRLIIEKVKLPMTGGGRGGGEELVYGTKPMTGMEFSTILKAFSSLGLTEGDRRRMRIELERDWSADKDDGSSIESDRMTLLQGGKSESA